MKAVIADAHLRSSLAGIRGLGRAGRDVVAVGPRWTASGLWSRYASSRVLSGKDDDSLVRTLRELTEPNGRIVVYPGAEQTLDTLLAVQRPSTWLELPYGDRDALRHLRDKGGLGPVADAAGLAVPHTVVVATAGELAGWTPPGPCVVKAAVPGKTQFEAVVVHTKEELSRVTVKRPPDEALLLQERAQPPLTSIAVVIDRRGILRARFQQRALRTWPPTGGVSSAAVSVVPDEGLVRRISAMLTGVKFAGLAQVQFVWQRGEPVIIDVNPRFYGSLPLALACGVNLPAVWHASVMDEQTAGVGTYRTGVVFRWFEGEVLRALHAGRTRSEDLHEDPTSGAGELSMARRATVGAVWAWDDALPAGMALGEWVAGVVARRRKRR